MTLPLPRAVGFAVRGGMTIDAAEWVTVELDPFLERRSRGLIVATEPVDPNGHAFEMARIARELIVSELRSMDDLPPDEAIGRAFAAANGMLFDEAQSNPTRGYDRKVLVGATAVVLEGHRCIVGHVPPGQLVIIEDQLAYPVPDLSSWTPGFTFPEGMSTPPEPLGYTSWVAPILAETELSDGDEVLICSASLAESLAADLEDTEVRLSDLAGYHGRSPDQTVDVFKGLLIADRIEDGAALVLAFPPQPGSFGIVSMGDVRWRLQDRRRRMRAHIRSLLPRRRKRTIATDASVDRSDENVLADGDDGTANVDDAIVNASAAPRFGGLRRRSLRRRSAETWAMPGETRQYGLPRTHGVQMHRNVSADRGDSRWRLLLPRIPLVGPLLTALLVGLIAVVTFGIWSMRTDDPLADTAYLEYLNRADQHILVAEGSAAEEETRQALDLAQEALEGAREEGAPEGELDPRQLAITDARDDIDNVIRVDNLVRVGTLPDELQGGGTSAQLTGSGLFLVNGGLYQIRTDQRQIVAILEEGEITSDVQVGPLFGIAVDTLGLHVTDGTHVFTLRTDGAWVPVELEEINNLGPWTPGPIGAFGGSLYLLAPEYRNIYRFDTESADGVAEPIDWVLASVRPDLVRAVDMTIDRSIYVLLDNRISPDEVLTYTQGDLAARTRIPYLDPETTRPIAVLLGPATQFMYVAVEDDAGGAIIVFDLASEAAWQLRMPADFSVDDAEVASPFEGLQDLAIDEYSGTLYLVNDDAVWTAQYQLPVDPQGTPVAVTEIAEPSAGD